MADDHKTRAELIAELVRLRQKIQSLARNPDFVPADEPQTAQASGDDNRIANSKSSAVELSRFREFIENIDDGCFEVDLNGAFTYVNPAMSRIHGYSHDELIGMDHRDYASPEESKRIFHVFNTIHETGKSERIFDYTIKHKDGTERNLEVSASLIKDAAGKLVGFRGITRDRTDKMVKEQELARYRDFVENVHEACMEVDLKGNVTFCNDAACRVFGYSFEQLMGMNNRAYTTPETAEKIYRIFNRVYKTGEAAKINDYEIIRGDGRLRYLDVTVSLILDKTGKAIGFRGVLTDMTERKNIAREAERLNALLSQAQRLEAIGTLAGGVAHNFNNLFMSIQGYISLIMINVKSDHPHYKRFKTIETHLRRGSELTAKLLAYASNVYQATQEAAVDKILETAIAVFNRSPHRIGFERGYGKQVRSVKVDMEQMTHVFINLFSNAEQAMPEGGTVHIATENVVLDSDFVQPYHRMPGAYVKIEVRDSGAGIAEDALPHIFEPFFTTKGFSSGAGLGLASAYGVVQSHGGIIVAQSEPGQGSTITVYLKAVKPETKKPDKKPNAAIQDAKTILLVDDEQVVLDVIGEMLQRVGYRVMTADNAQAAIELFGENRGKINLLIMDMVMPGIGGDQAIETIREMDPQVKVILISGFVATSEQNAATIPHGRAFLQKPIEPKLLRQTIDQLLSV